MSFWFMELIYYVTTKTKIYNYYFNSRRVEKYKPKKKKKKRRNGE